MFLIMCIICKFWILFQGLEKITWLADQYSGWLHSAISQIQSLLLPMGQQRTWAGIWKSFEDYETKCYLVINYISEKS